MNEKRMKKLGTWNLVALILASIGAVFSLVGLPGVLFPNKATYVEMGGEELYNQVNSWVYKVPSVIGVIVSIVFAALFFVAYKQIKAGKLPNKLIYFLNIGYFVLSLILQQFVFHTVSTASLSSINDSEMSGIVSEVVAVASVVGIVFATLLHLPQVMCLIQIFKLEGSTQENQN